MNLLNFSNPALDFYSFVKFIWTENIVTEYCMVYSFIGNISIYVTIIGFKLLIYVLSMETYYNYLSKVMAHCNFLIIRFRQYNTALN